MTYTRLNGIGFRQYTWGPGYFFAGLGGFGLRFEDGDHKVKYISVGGTTATSPQERHDYNLGLYDNSAVLNTEDIIEGWVKYIDIGPIEEEFAMGTFYRRGTVRLPITPIGPEESFVLRGFSIKQTGEHDHNIRRIGLRVNPSGNAVNVTFEDNSPDDDGFEVKLVYGRVISSRASYNMPIQFVGPFTSQKEFTVSTRLDKEYSNPSLLTGFLFEFLDTDHFIREIKIDPVSDDEIEVTFTDDEMDNPVNVTIDYLGYNVIREDS